MGLGLSSQVEFRQVPAGGTTWEERPQERLGGNPRKQRQRQRSALGQRRGAARTLLLPRWGEDGAPALLGAWQSAAEKRQEAGGLSHKVLEQLVCLSKS